MQREVFWIKQALEANPTKTKTGLARALNIDKSGVSRLLRGERRLKFAEAQRASEYLEVGAEVVPKVESASAVYPDGRQSAHTPTGYSMAHSASDELPPQPQTAPNPVFDDGVAPLYPVTIGKNGLWKIDRANFIEQRRRAPEFAGAAQVFGFYVPDASMAPRFGLGETAWVNPARPATAGEDALMVTDEKDASLTATICLVRLLSINGVYVGFQYGLGKERTFDNDRWRAFYVYGRN